MNLNQLSHLGGPTLCPKKNWMVKSYMGMDQVAAGTPSCSHQVIALFFMDVHPQ